MVAATTLFTPPARAPFEFFRVLGEGGSGIVYEAGRVGVAGDRLAVKVLRGEPTDRERRRFLEEAERMQRVRHRGLVRLEASGILPDGRPYLAMPLLRGETLAERLRRGPLPAAVALAHFATLAAALEAIHAAGMVHRDVKPENVFLQERREGGGADAVLLDFGIARDIDEPSTTTTSEGRVRGTPAYMAPERFFGAPATVRSDVYELAVVLYTMVTGRLPWGSEENVAERLNPASPRDVGADVSRRVATVVLRALSTRPEVRPSSAGAFAAAILEEEAVPSPPSSRRTLDLPLIAVADPVTANVPVQAPRRRPWALVVAVPLLGLVALGARQLAPRTTPRTLAHRSAIAFAQPTILPVPMAKSPAEPVPTTVAAPPRPRVPAPPPKSAAQRTARASGDEERFFEDRR